MFDDVVSVELDGLVEALATVAPASSESEAISRIVALERLESACAAAQARESVAFDSLRRQDEAARGIPASERGRGVGAEIALARRESPSRGSRHLGLARALVEELPHTMAALTSGETSEWRATLVCRETACLSPEDRALVDAEIGPRLGTLGDRRVERDVRALSQTLDPRAEVERMRRAENERRVTLRPAPDAMAYLTAFLPMKQAVAAYAALTREAESRRAVGAEGLAPRGQCMADIAVERLTGAANASELPVELHLVMTDSTFLAGGREAAWIPGIGPLPAASARDLLSPERTAQAWLRRLYTAPGTDELVAMDSVRREFSGGLRRMIVLRDDVCATPWCEAPIRHVDHVVPFADGGATSYENGSGLCERCNYVKERPGWRHRAGPGGLDITTPTGHRARGRERALPVRGAPQAAPRAASPGPSPGTPQRASKKSQPRESISRASSSNRAAHAC